MVMIWLHKQLNNTPLPAERGSHQVVFHKKVKEVCPLATKKTVWVFEFIIYKQLLYNYFSKLPYIFSQKLDWNDPQSAITGSMKRSEMTL